MAGKEYETTDGHGEFIVREEGGHKVEKVIIIFIQTDSFDGDFCENGFDCWRELALCFP